MKKFTLLCCFCSCSHLMAQPEFKQEEILQLDSVIVQTENTPDTLFKSEIEEETTSLYFETDSLLSEKDLTTKVPLEMEEEPAWKKNCFISPQLTLPIIYLPEPIILIEWDPNYVVPFEIGKITINKPNVNNPFAYLSPEEIEKIESGTASYKHQAIVKNISFYIFWTSITLGSFITMIQERRKRETQTTNKQP